MLLSYMLRFHLFFYEKDWNNTIGTIFVFCTLNCDWFRLSYLNVVIRSVNRVYIGNNIDFAISKLKRNYIWFLFTRDVKIHIHVQFSVWRWAPNCPTAYRSFYFWHCQLWLFIAEDEFALLYDVFRYLYIQHSCI